MCARSRGGFVAVVVIFSEPGAVSPEVFVEEFANHKVSPGSSAGSSSKKTTVTYPAAFPFRTGHQRDVIILGSAAIDVTAKIDPSADPSAAIQSTARGSLTLTPGGVGRNIAECATRLLGRDRVLLVSPIGGVRQEESGRMEADDLGKTLLRRMEEAGMDTSGMIIREPSFLGKDRRTAGCSLVLAADGDLTSGVADMSIVETLSADEVSQGGLNVSDLFGH